MLPALLPRLPGHADYLGDGAVGVAVGMTGGAPTVVGVDDVGDVGEVGDEGDAVLGEAVFADVGAVVGGTPLEV